MSHSYGTLVAWFLTGVAQSLGPCVVSRAVALSAMTAAATRPLVVVAAFIVGIVGAYELYLTLTGVVYVLQAYQTVLFLVMAASMVVGFILTLRGVHSCDVGSSKPARSEESLGGVALLGAGTVLQLAPCCTLPALGIVSLSTQTGIPFAAATLAAYALGHAVPLVVIGVGSVGLRRVIGGLASSRFLGYLNAGLLLYLGIYFAVQA